MNCAQRNAVVSGWRTGVEEGCPCYQGSARCGSVGRFEQIETGVFMEMKHDASILCARFLRCRGTIPAINDSLDSLG
jgi:hypothetical protein